MLGYPDRAARRWEAKKLRIRLFAAATLARRARVQFPHLAAVHPGTTLVLPGRAAITRLTAPGCRTALLNTKIVERRVVDPV